MNASSRRSGKKKRQHCNVSSRARKTDGSNLTKEEWYRKWEHWEQNCAAQQGNKREWHHSTNRIQWWVRLYLWDDHDQHSFPHRNQVSLASLPRFPALVQNSTVQNRTENAEITQNVKAGERQKLAERAEEGKRSSEIQDTTENRETIQNTREERQQRTEQKKLAALARVVLTVRFCVSTLCDIE